MASVVPSQYRLTASQAAKQAEKHAREIKAALPKKALHKIPYRTILLTANRILSEHADFEQVTNLSGRKYCIPKNNAYPHYEIGHQILTDRLISGLVGDKLLPRKHAALFKDALSRLYYSPPTSEFTRQLEKFNELVEKLGEDKTNALLAEAEHRWTQEYQSQVDAQRKLTEKEGIEYNLGDMFGNPASHRTLNRIDKRTPLTVGEYRKKVSHLIERSRENETYPSEAESRK